MSVVVVMQQLTGDLGREPHLSEIGRAMGISESEALEIINYVRTPRSLSAPLGPADSGLTLDDTIADQLMSGAEAAGSFVASDT